MIMNLKTILRKPMPVWILAVLLIVTIILIVQMFFLNSRIHESPEGRILFWHQPAAGSYDQHYGLYSMDGDGNNIHYLGSFTGSPAWSSDGNYIAVGCWNYDEGVCILDTNTLHDFRRFPIATSPLGSSIRKDTKRIALPRACQEAITADWGIQSISWSADGEKIAVVCGNEPQKYHEVCILSLNGDAYCWDHSISRSVIRAVFSPVEDRLAISNYPAYGTQIYLVNPDGSDPVYLADGWSPEWSPDGSQVAFIRFEEGSYWRDDNGNVHVDETHSTYREIAVINKDGTGLHRVYWRPETSEYISFISLKCGTIGGACRLAWSPDGRYIALSASYEGGNIYGTFRLDLKTSKVIFLMDPNSMIGYNGELDWGP
jgi:WD40 repeat protein